MTNRKKKTQTEQPPAEQTQSPGECGECDQLRTALLSAFAEKCGAYHSGYKEGKRAAFAGQRLILGRATENLSEALADLAALALAASEDK